MASYKVAQDVEAEDKLLGPFSFRQFMYLVIAVMAGVVAYGMSQVFLPLFIIPTPIVLFFLILALPLRKDQPMEVYLAAIVSFYIKPRKRLWQPDGIESMIEITAPNTDDQVRTKDISGSEAERRLAYLATLADTHGWSIRNATAAQETSMVSDVYNEAQAYQNEFDDDGYVAQKFETMIDQADAARKQTLISNMNQPSVTTSQTATSPPVIRPAQTIAAPVAATTTDPPATTTVQFDPYPSNMRQHVIHPTGQAPPIQPSTTPPSQPSTAPLAATTPTPTSATPAATTPTPAPATPAEPPTQTTSGTSVSPDIISLANNNDLSIETIAREAHRIEEKHKRDEEQEVVISLR